MTNFVNGPCSCVCVRACMMDHCHNSGAKQMGSLRQVFPAHIRGDQECCLTAVRESPCTHQRSLHAGVCVKLNGNDIPLPPPISSEEEKFNFHLFLSRLKNMRGQKKKKNASVNFPQRMKGGRDDERREKM